MGFHESAAGSPITIVRLPVVVLTDNTLSFNKRLSKKCQVTNCSHTGRRRSKWI